MTSFTIDQLKKELSDRGIPLPASSAKKKDYVKLYEDSLVSSSFSESQFEDTRLIDNEFEERIKSMTDDDLYEELRSHGVQCGPVNGNTRRVYEIKLSKIYNNIDDSQTPASEINGENVEEINSEYVSTERREATPEHRIRARHEPTPEVIMRPRHEATPETSVRARKNTPVPDSKPIRYSFIETISRNSAQKYIQPLEGDFTNFKLPTGATLHENQSTPKYKGKWSPKIHELSGQPTQVQNVNYKRMIFIFMSGLLLLTLVCLIHQQWNATDPYKLLEEDAEKKIQHITENQEVEN